MSNKRYRFQRATLAVEDCYEQLKMLFTRGGSDKLPASNDRERKARARLVNLCCELTMAFAFVSSGYRAEGWNTGRILAHWEKFGSRHEAEEHARRKRKQKRGAR